MMTQPVGTTRGARHRHPPPRNVMGGEVLVNRHRGGKWAYSLGRVSVVVAVEREGDPRVARAERDRAELALGPTEAAAAPGDGNGEVRAVLQPGDLTRHGDLALAGEGER